MLGNLLDTPTVANQRQDPAGPVRAGSSGGAAGHRFADHLANEQQRPPPRQDRQSRSRPEHSDSGRAPATSPGAGPAEARGKPLPPPGRHDRNGNPGPQPINNRAAHTDSVPARQSPFSNPGVDSDAALVADLNQRAAALRAGDEVTAPAPDDPALAALVGLALRVAPLASVSDDAAGGVDIGDGLSESFMFSLGLGSAEALAAEFSITDQSDLTAKASATELTAEWLDSLSDGELANVWRMISGGDMTVDGAGTGDSDLASVDGDWLEALAEPFLSPELADELAALVMDEVRTRPNVLEMAQFSPDWVKIEQPNGDALWTQIQEPVDPEMAGPLQDMVRMTAIGSDDVDLELAPSKDAPLTSRAQLAQLAEQLQARVDRDGGRADELGSLRQSLDSQINRDSARPTVAELVKQHIERQIPVKNSASELTQRLSERMVMMIGQDIQEARIRLNPPEMGHLDIRVTTQNDQVQVQVVAQQPMVRDLLEQHAHRLRDMLEQQGFSQVNVDVSDHADQGGQQDDSDSDGTDRLAGPGEDDDPGGVVTRQPVGLVDHYV